MAMTQDQLTSLRGGLERFASENAQLNTPLPEAQPDPGATPQLPADPLPESTREVAAAHKERPQAPALNQEDSRDERKRTGKKSTPKELSQFIADLDACQKLIKASGLRRRELASQLQALGVNISTSILSSIKGGSATTITRARNGPVLLNPRRLTDLKVALEQLPAQNAQPQQPPAEPEPAPTPQMPTETAPDLHRR